MIIGATGTLGSAMARRLVRRGDSVIAVARQLERLHHLREELVQLQRTAAPTIDIQACDLFEPNASSELASLFRDTTDVIVAMGSFPRTPISHVSRHDFASQMIEHCALFVELARAFAPSVAKASGAILGFSDNGVEKPYLNHIAYLSAKGALTAAVRALALEWSKPEMLVRVGVVSIGVVTDPEINHPMRGEALAKRARVGRTGTPEEVAHVALAMLDATWVSGEIWSVGN